MASRTEKLRLGTRASALARWQAEWVASRLTERGIAVELVPITTQGDVKTGPLGQIGGQGLFTKELQRALLDSQIDLAVHSLKDLPTAPVEGLSIAAVPERESTADVLVSNRADSLESLPTAARIGTGSLRRKAQLLHLRSDFLVEDIRGNVETRVRKLDDDQFDAIVLAEAGLKRLGLAGRIACLIPQSTMLPAVGQGALAIEARSDDAPTRGLLAPLDCLETHQAVLAERTLLFELRAGCLAPVGAFGRVTGGRLVLDAVVLSPDGQRRLLPAGQGMSPRQWPLASKWPPSFWSKARPISSLLRGRLDLVPANIAACVRQELPIAGRIRSLFRDALPATFSILTLFANAS